MDFAKTIKFDLNSGETVELQMTQTMIDQICETFSLSSVDDITQKHVKYFLVNGMINAVEKSKNASLD